MKWLQEHLDLDADTIIAEIEYNLRTVMERDQGTGEWVGLLGFSQGANVAASMLYERQLRMDADKNPNADGFGGEKWRFAVFMAGRAPLIRLSKLTENDEAFRSVAETPKWTDPRVKIPVKTRLRLPTVHVHGLLDPGLVWHRKLRDEYCDEEAASLVEWEGDHRIPYKPADVRPVVDAIFKAAKVLLGLNALHNSVLTTI